MTEGASISAICRRSSGHGKTPLAEKICCGVFLFSATQPSAILGSAARPARPTPTGSRCGSRSSSSGTSSLTTSPVASPASGVLLLTRGLGLTCGSVFPTQLVTTDVLAPTALKRFERSLCLTNALRVPASVNVPPHAGSCLATNTTTSRSITGIDQVEVEFRLTSSRSTAECADSASLLGTGRRILVACHGPIPLSF